MKATKRWIDERKVKVEKKGRRRRRRRGRTRTQDLKLCERRQVKFQPRQVRVEGNQDGGERRESVDKRKEEKFQPGEKKRKRKRE